MTEVTEVVTESDVSKQTRNLFDKGIIAMERNNLVYAMDMFMAVLKIEPRFLQARKLLRAASIKQFNESGGGSITHIVTTVTGFPALLSGFLGLKRGKAVDVLQTCEQLLRKDPFNFHFIRLLCKAAEAADIPEAAIQTLVVIREHYPENVEILTRLGKLYTATDQMDDAKECFESVVNLRPHDAIAMKVLKDAMARNSMAKGGWSEVVTKDGASYRDVVKDVKGAAILEQGAKVVKEDRNLELLIQESLKKLEQEPENMTNRRALVNLYVEADRFDDAIRALEETRRLAGASDPVLDQLLASIHIQRFDYEIEQCRQKGDTDGVSARESEKHAFLFDNTTSRIKRYPNDLPLRYDYGVLLYEDDQLNEAIKQFQMAWRNPRRRVQSFYYMGMCFKKKQQFDMAKEQLEKADSELTEMNDLKKDIYYELGAIHESLKNFDQANKYYKEIYQADIGYKDVADKIEDAYKK